MSPTAPFSQRHARLGWTLLAVALTFGATLEVLEAYRWAPIAADEWKRRLWSLAHFHGAALGLVNLVYTRWATRLDASFALAAGSLTMPIGFFLGGIGHPEGDPSIGIFLAPVGALGVIYCATVHAWSEWRSSHKSR